MESPILNKLMLCAEAIGGGDQILANSLLDDIQKILSGKETDIVTRKVANCFVEALSLKLQGREQEHPNNKSSLFTNLDEFYRYRRSPFNLFAQITTEKSILKAASGKKSVHFIDFSDIMDLRLYDMMLRSSTDGIPLLLAEKEKKPGVPSRRITSMLSNLSTDFQNYVRLEQRIRNDILGISQKFNWKQYDSVDDLVGSVLQLKRESEDETVIIRWVFELHKLLTVSGALDTVLSKMKELEPEMMIIVEQEIDHTSRPHILDRITDLFQYYSTIFYFLDGYFSGDDKDKLTWEMYFKQQIAKLLAGNGNSNSNSIDGVERHQKLAQWRDRLCHAGFRLIKNIETTPWNAPELFHSMKFTMGENDGCPLLCYNSRPLVATSAWKPNGASWNMNDRGAYLTNAILPIMQRDWSTTSDTSSMATTGATYHRNKNSTGRTKRGTAHVISNVYHDEENSDTSSSSPSHSMTFKKPLTNTSSSDPFPKRAALTTSSSSSDSFMKTLHVKI